MRASTINNFIYYPFIILLLLLHILSRSQYFDNWQSLSIRVRYQKKEKSDRIKLLINEVEILRHGPFLPLTKHPITLSLLMPFGGVGGLYLIGYLASII